MSESQGYLERELAPHIDGEVRTDPATRALYSTAACIYRMVPLGVIFPKTPEDVSFSLQYCSDRSFPVTARGAGSGVAGQSVGEGLIIDFTRHMDQILEINRDEGWVRVEPGVVFADLNRRLKPYGLVFPPNPSSGEFCTVGGMLANNSGGAHSVMYGTTDDHVLSATLFLADGSELVADNHLSVGDGTVGKVWAVADILERNEAIISAGRPQVSKNASGYNVWGVLHDGAIDMAKLVVGSEGTLGLFTEARLKLSPLPQARATAMFCFTELEGMAESVREIKRVDPSAVELMDKSLIDLLSTSGSTHILEDLPKGNEAILLVEFSGQEREEVEEKAAICFRNVRELGFSSGYKLAIDPADQDRLWGIRDKASSVLRLIHHPEKPLRFIEDGTVAVENLPEYIHRLRRMLSTFGLKAAIFGHAGDGNVHVNPFVDVTKEDFRDVMQKVTQEVASIVSELGGTLSGEHGDGRLRTPLLPKMYGTLCDVFLEIKRVFDPEGILNPGIIVSRHGIETITENLRYGYASVHHDSILSPSEVRIEIDKCHGCGSCRVYCPPFTALGTEGSTARAKANLLREYMIGEIVSEDTVTSPMFKEVMNLCYNCKLCTTACPSQVDIPWLAILSRSTVHDREGFSLQDRFLMSSGAISAMSRRIAVFSNKLLGSRSIRQAMDKTIGVDKRRFLPPFDASNIEDSGKKAGKEFKGDILYFPGCFASYHSRQNEMRSTLIVLNAMGYRVHVIEEMCCGVARLTIGDVKGFQKEADRLVEKLIGMTQNGGKIVFSSPSCLMCVREEYPRHLRKDETRQIASLAVDVMELLEVEGDFIWRNKETKTECKSVVLHVPCHVKTNRSGQAFLRVMKNLPGVDVVRTNERCCGLAGTFGMRKERFDLSMNIGSALFEEIEGSGKYDVITPCGACKLQIEQGKGAKVTHPIQWVARFCI